MRDLAPDIYRQRLLLEGFWGEGLELDAEGVRALLTGLAGHLSLRAYGEPVVFSPGGRGKELNQGFDAFVPLVDSGIAGYFWSARRFFSVLVYSCKPFAPEPAREYLAQRLEACGEFAVMEF